MHNWIGHWLSDISTKNMLWERHKISNQVSFMSKLAVSTY